MTSVAIWLGTLILFLPSADRAIVAADSRHDGGDPARRDEARKIFLCGRAAVCAVSGGLRIDASVDEAAGTLDIAALLERTSESMRAAEDQSPAKLLEMLRSSLDGGIGAFWSRYLAGRRVAAPLSTRLGAPSVCTILFAVQAGTGPLAVAQIQFPFTERRLPDGTWAHELLDPVVRLAEAARPLAQGHAGCLPSMDLRAAGLGEIDAIYSRAQEVEFCREVIGGPVDVASIEGGEAKWLRRKLSPPEKVDQPLPLPVH